MVMSSQQSDSALDAYVAEVPATLYNQQIVVIPQMASIKITVNEQLFNVPINKDIINDLTIGWLAEETARRYYKLEYFILFAIFPSLHSFFF